MSGSRRPGEITARHRARMFPHHVELPTPVRGFGHARLQALYAAAERIAAGRHGHWSATRPDRSVWGFADARTADAFRAWLRESPIDWTREPD
jgi:hypothetical protein